MTDILHIFLKVFVYLFGTTIFSQIANYPVIIFRTSLISGHEMGHAKMEPDTGRKLFLKGVHYLCKGNNIH